MITGKRVCIALLCLLALTCTACKSTVQIIGTWSAPLSQVGLETNEEQKAQMLWTFHEDGTGDKTSKGLTGGKEISVSFTWKVEENVLTIFFEEEIEPEQSFEISARKDTLILSKGSRRMELTKAE